MQTKDLSVFDTRQKDISLMWSPQGRICFTFSHERLSPPTHTKGGISSSRKSKSMSHFVCQTWDEQEASWPSIFIFRSVGFCSDSAVNVVL